MTESTEDKEHTKPDKIEPCEITPAQKNDWDNTASLLMWTCPGFRHLFLRLLVNHDGPIAPVCSFNVPVAATDARNVIINPKTFFKYPLKQRVFIVAHEILHNVYNDVHLLVRCRQMDRVPMNDGTHLPYSENLLQMAMDYRINALLVESKVGELPPDGCHDTAIATGESSVLDVYKKLFQQQKSNGGGKGQKPGNGKPDPLANDVLRPGASTGEHTTEVKRNDQQWRTEISRAQTIEQQKSQGKMSASLMRLFKGILEPEVYWLDVIETMFRRRVGSGNYDWRRPDRRFIVRDLHMPSRSGHGAGWLVVWGDTSGSIGASELASYIAELSGILQELKPRRLTVIWCDAEIKRIDEIEDLGDLDKIKYQGAPGGGGTDCHPVFNWIEKNAYEPPDAFIGFTDGYVGFPSKPPPFPIVWASTTDQKYPWGDVVRINKKPAAV